MGRSEHPACSPSTPVRVGTDSNSAQAEDRPLERSRPTPKSFIVGGIFLMCLTSIFSAHVQSLYSLVDGEWMTWFLLTPP